MVKAHALHQQSTFSTRVDGAGENRSNKPNVNAPTSPTTAESVQEEEEVAVDDYANDDDEVVQTLEPAVTDVSTAVTTTSSGHVSRAPTWMNDYTMAAMQLTNQEMASLNLTKGFEMGLMGAGIGGGFINTQELHVMKYNQAMKGPDKRQWTVAVDE